MCFNGVTREDADVAQDKADALGDAINGRKNDGSPKHCDVRFDVFINALD